MKNRIFSAVFAPIILGLGCESLSTAAPQSLVQVWDNVLPKAGQDHLHKLASKEVLGHQAFSRPLVEGNSKNSDIERSIDGILTELGDESRYVEYWARQEWRSIEAHADVDEFLAKKRDSEGNTNSSDYRYPINGHVLYLKVGSKVRGPTCVFPGKKSGGDLVDNKSSGDSGIPLVTVPAFSGRLLRFAGDSLHAVPRPADLWLLKFVQGAPKFDPEDEWGRSVILFNTWEQSPMEVPLDSSQNDTPDASSSFYKCNNRSRWYDTFHYSSSNRDESSCFAAASHAKIWLLGNERRRGYPMRTIKLSAPSTLSEALHESKKVHVLQFGSH